jgi:predicted ferric reductase
VNIFLKNHRGRILFYLVFGLIPVCLLFLQLNTNSLFSSYYSSLTVLAKIAGVLGVCFFTGNLFLSGRYKIADRLFLGLDKVYLFHRQTGKLTFYLLTFHVLAMTFRLVQDSWHAVIVFLLDLTSPEAIPVTFGKIAFCGLLIVIVITLFFRKIKYERLKFIHTFMGVFLFFGGLHVYLIPSDISTNMYLRWYILTLVSLALVSYFVRTVFKEWLVKRIKADVIAVNALPGDVTEVVMKPHSGNISFHPGQFIFVKFKQENFPYEDHPFSLTASQYEGQFRISAKGVGDFTRKLSELKVGAVARIQGPFGSFSYDFVKNKKQIWVAGGIGITPFISMARSLHDRVRRNEDMDNVTRDISLFYSVQDEQYFVYKDELQKIAEEVPGLKVYFWNVKTSGFLTTDYISKTVSINGKDIFICGPKPLLILFNKNFRALDVPKHMIHFELFTLL